MILSDDEIERYARHLVLREVGGDTVIGPMLVGMEKPVQIATMSATANELLTLAVLAGAGIAQ